MMRLSIGKSESNEEQQKDDEDDEDNLPHGTKVLKELVMPWANTDMIIFEDSYFISVPAAEELWKHGLRFVCVIKTETHQFPMAFLYNIELQN